MLFKNKTYQLMTNLSEQEVFRILRYNTTEEQLMHFTKPKTFFIGLYIFVTSIFLIFASIMIVNDNLHPKAIILIPFPILFFGVLIYQVNTSDSKNESINFLEKLFQTKIHQIK